MYVPCLATLRPSNYVARAVRRRAREGVSAVPWLQPDPARLRRRPQGREGERLPGERERVTFVLVRLLVHFLLHSVIGLLFVFAKVF